MKNNLKFKNSIYEKNGLAVHVLINKIFISLWRFLVCPHKHIEIIYLDNTKANFCMACGIELNENIYRKYHVLSNDGEFDQYLFAVSPGHLLALIKHLYHPDNLTVKDFGFEKGMKHEGWYKEMAHIINTMPANQRPGWEL